LGNAIKRHRLEYFVAVVAATVLPVSAIREWTHAKPPFTAEIYAPLIRNRLCVAVPKARPATRLSRFWGN